MHHRRLRLKKKRPSELVCKETQLEDTSDSQSTKKRKRHNNSDASPTKPPAFSANNSSADFPREIVALNVTASNQVSHEVIKLEEIDEERSTAVGEIQQFEGPRTRKLPKGTGKRKLSKLRHLTRFMSSSR